MDIVIIGGLAAGAAWLASFILSHITQNFNVGIDNHLGDKPQRFHQHLVCRLGGVGIMVGLGEDRDEIPPVLKDMREYGVEILTIGQYLQPTSKHAPIARYVPPTEFAEWAELASGMGFAHAYCGPLVRSSFHAEEVFASVNVAVS